MELIKPPFGILPWNGNTTGDIERVMTTVYNRLKEEDLYRIVFHERSDFTFSQFIQFFSRPDVLPQVCFEIDADGKFLDLAGLCWLAEYDPMPSHTRATGSFVFYKRFQTPKWTEGFGKKLLKYYFEDLGISTLIGMTPGPNRAARMYSKRIGMDFVAVLPKYTCFLGKQVDAHISLMHRDRYDMLYGQKALIAELVEV